MFFNNQFDEAFNQVLLLFTPRSMKQNTACTNQTQIKIYDRGHLLPAGQSCKFATGACTRDGSLIRSSVKDYILVSDIWYRSNYKHGHMDFVVHRSQRCVIVKEDRIPVCSVFTTRCAMIPVQFIMVLTMIEQLQWRLQALSTMMSSWASKKFMGGWCVPAPLTARPVNFSTDVLSIEPVTSFAPT